jgi:hypothetical protein
VSGNYTYSTCTSEGEPGTDIGNAFPVPIADFTSTQPRPDTSTNRRRTVLPIAGTTSICPPCS